MIYLVLTMFAMFYRPDFMSMTACSIGIYGVAMPHGIQRKHFRMLVVFLFISFVYDLIFLVFLHDSTADDELDSNMAVNVRRFAYFFSWLSFAFRPIVILVFWKVSLEFRRIIRQKGTNQPGAPGQSHNSGLNDDQLQMAAIMSQYGGMPL
jgi:hypothetical protein